LSTFIRFALNKFTIETLGKPNLINHEKTYEGFKYFTSLSQMGKGSPVELPDHLENRMTSTSGNYFKVLVERLMILILL